MPLLFLAWLTYAAGLFMGFGGVAFPGVALAVLWLGWGVLQRDARSVALPLLLAAGALRAHGERATDAGCVQRTILDGRATVLLATNLAPGARATGQIVDVGCAVRVTLFASSGRAVAGSIVEARGTAYRTDAGVLLERARVRSQRPPGWMARWRARSGRAIDRLFGSDAGLAKALLIADTRSVDPEIRSRYADAGMIHLLSVSGLHVAIIAGAAELLLVAARLRRERAVWISLALTFVYVLLIGAPAPAVRSGIMLASTAVSRLLQRPSSPWAALALGGLVPLYESRVVLDLGYQLSVAGMAGLLAAGALTGRLPRLHGARWKQNVVRALLASVLASLVTLPLVAWVFGRVSVVAPLTNLVAGPLFTVLQPALFLALLLAPWHAGASLVADAARVALRAVDALATAGAAVPLAALSVAPSLYTAVLLGVLAMVIVLACVARHPERPLVVGTVAIALLVWSPRPPGRGEMEMHMIDVGQGDAIAVRTPHGHWILFDAGRSWPRGDAGRSTILPYLRRRGGPLDLFVLTHPHADHAGGAASVLRALRPRRYVDGAFVAPAGDYRASLVAAAESGVAWRRVKPGDSLTVDGVVVTLLAPDSAWTATLRDANEASTVARVRYGRIRFLLTGDAERGEEAWLLARGAEALRAEVLKVAHHGSSTSTTPEFVAAVRPRIALVSVGARNFYGHPNPDVVRRLMASGAQVLRTDRLGSIVVSTDGASLRVEAGGDTWRP
ncbi:MAG TPA: DNA internalization-related competence protein ComEC/Rec2 [Gemmatimonadaceae bacterium]|nr:DNA internalization-related competence protein ComEC/Rec2 [Gemmatimonadaceae bacterium]